MNDDDMLAVMRGSLASTKDSMTDVRMGRPTEAIIRRARGRQLRRGLPAISAGGLALGIGLALAFSGGPSAPRAVHVNLAAWSVNSTSAGLVKVTIRELKDPAQLSQTLADAGVHVRFTSGRVCAPASGDLPQLQQVAQKQPGNGDLVLTIDPAAMPAGTELVIGTGTFRQGSEHFRAAALTLVKDGTQLDCGSGGVKTGV